MVSRCATRPALCWPPTWTTRRSSRQRSRRPCKASSCQPWAAPSSEEPLPVTSPNPCRSPLNVSNQTRHVALQEYQLWRPWSPPHPPGRWCPSPWRGRRRGRVRPCSFWPTLPSPSPTPAVSGSTCPSESGRTTLSHTVGRFHPRRLRQPSSRRACHRPTLRPPPRLAPRLLRQSRTLLVTGTSRTH